MSKHSPEPLLPLARRRLADAVSDLTDPVPVWTNGVCRYTPGTYARLRAALRQRPGNSVRLVPGSRPPCHSGALALIVEIDRTAAVWEPGEKTTVDRLRQVAAKDRSPQDVPLLEDYRKTIQEWTVRAADLLADRVDVALRFACPSCGRRFYYRRDAAGETVRSWVLRVGDEGARCMACTATWSVDKLGFLAALLGCTPQLPA